MSGPGFTSISCRKALIHMDVSRRHAPSGRQQDASCPDEHCPAGLVETCALGWAGMPPSGRPFEATRPASDGSHSQCEAIRARAARDSAASSPTLTDFAARISSYTKGWEGDGSPWSASALGIGPQQTRGDRPSGRYILHASRHGERADRCSALLSPGRPHSSHCPRHQLRAAHLARVPEWRDRRGDRP